MNISNNGKNGPTALSNRINKTTLSWAFYDWANSAFATTVMAGFFPLFFKQYWSGSSSATESTYYLGVANSLASFSLALLAPYLGALADISHNKKHYLGFFAILGILCTASLYLVNYGQWQIAIALYIFATLGFFGSNIFYDALLPIISLPDKVDFLSGFGFALGYLGGGLLFLLNVVMTTKPHWFGLISAAEAVKWSFILVAIWWFLFALPLFFNVHEKISITKKSQTSDKLFLRQGFASLWQTMQELAQTPTTLLFLVAYLFYFDGVNTIIKMAVDYGLALGFASENLIAALLITQFVGFPAAIAFGYFGEKWGAVKAIFFALISYGAITLWGYHMTNVKEFYLLAVAIGLVQGGIQALSRSYFSKMVPQNKEAEYFGFFNMTGKSSAILGPFLVGYVSMSTGNPRFSILVILCFFVLGGCFLWGHWHWQTKAEGTDHDLL